MNDRRGPDLPPFDCRSIAAALHRTAEQHGAPPLTFSSAIPVLPSYRRALRLCDCGDAVATTVVAPCGSPYCLLPYAVTCNVDVTADLPPVDFTGRDDASGDGSGTGQDAGNGSADVAKADAGDHSGDAGLVASQQSTAPPTQSSFHSLFDDLATLSQPLADDSYMVESGGGGGSSQALALPLPSPSGASALGGVVKTEGRVVGDGDGDGEVTTPTASLSSSKLTWAMLQELADDWP